MKKITLILLSVLTLTWVSCSSEKDNPATAENDESWRLEGDRSIYGLACEGFTDSVVVLLPSDCSDPITFDIIKAMQAHRVLGMIKVGDNIAIVPNEEDSTVADVVIDIDQLKGTWCYIVWPKLRESRQTAERDRVLSKEKTDSIMEMFYVPREYGFSMKRQWQARSVGYVPENNLENSPVEYPKLGYFTEWHLLNGQLVITSGQPVLDEETGERHVTNLRNDTCDILLLGPDTLVLASEGAQRGYYRIENESDANKKAREIAEKRRQKALDDIKN